MSNQKTRASFGGRKPVAAIATAAAIAIVGASFGATSASAAAVPTSATPDLSKVSSWTQVSGYDFQGTTLPGTKTKALRISNSVADVTSDYQMISQLESPVIAAAGPRETSPASYDTFTANFTLSAKSYETQPDLAVEVSVNDGYNRAGGDLLLREEAGHKLTLTNFSAKPGSIADVGDWNYATTAIDFTKPVAIKLVSHFDPNDSLDTVKVYIDGSKTPALTGSTFETYADSIGAPAETVNNLLFRAVDRQVDETPDADFPWTNAVPTDDELVALKGNGFYFSDLSYAVSNTASASQMRFAAPTISNTTPVVGTPVSAGTDVDGIPTVSFAYQWLRNGVAISHANGATYTPTASDYKHKLSVRVTASKPGFTSSTRTSAQTAAVGIGNITVTSGPTINGAAAVGTKLTATISTAPVAHHSYQWLADGVAIKGATSSSYTIPAAELNKPISVIVKSYGTDLTTVTVTSDPTSAVVPGTLSFSTPKLTGTTKVGHTLSASVHATSGALLRYAFYSDGHLVQLSTSRTLALTWDLKGTQITVVVSGVKNGYTSAASAASEASVAIS